MKKSNKQFMILSALGILLVVDAHALSPLYLMAQYFPYNSFFMPMFVFISGYFFKPESIRQLHNYIGRKVKTLLVPFFTWHIVYGLLVNILKYAGVITYGMDLSVKSLFIEPFLECYSFEINNPAWFVPMLFMVVLSYAVIRFVFQKIWHDAVAMIVSFVLGTLCVFFSRKGCSVNPLWLIVLKTGFFMQFFQLGVFFKKYIEEYYRKVPKILLLLIPILINDVIIYFVGDINVLSLSAMSGFLNDYYAVPFLTAVTGTCFWLTIAEILVPILGDSKIVNYISANTFTVMMHHMFFFNLFNVLLAGLTAAGMLPISFDVEAMRLSAWYRCGTAYFHNIWYVPVGLCGPLLVKYGFETIKRKRGEKYAS